MVWVLLRPRHLGVGLEFNLRRKSVSPNVGTEGPRLEDRHGDVALVADVQSRLVLHPFPTHRHDCGQDVCGIVSGLVTLPSMRDAFVGQSYPSASRVRLIACARALWLAAPARSPSGHEGRDNAGRCGEPVVGQASVPEALGKPSERCRRALAAGGAAGLAGRTATRWSWSCADRIMMLNFAQGPEREAERSFTGLKGPRPGPIGDFFGAKM